MLDHVWEYMCDWEERQEAEHNFHINTGRIDLKTACDYTLEVLADLGKKAELDILSRYHTRQNERLLQRYCEDPEMMLTVMKHYAHSKKITELNMAFILRMMREEARAAAILERIDKLKHPHP